jgi:hypothetical protein
VTISANSRKPLISARPKRFSIVSKVQSSSVMGEVRAEHVEGDRVLDRFAFGDKVKSRVFCR